MTELTIKTNNQPRELKSIYDFDSADQHRIRSDFDWMNQDELETSYSFFKYRGHIYHLSEFMHLGSAAPSDLRSWDGYSSDSYFSGVVVRMVEDNEAVIVGRYFS